MEVGFARQLCVPIVGSVCRYVTKGSSVNIVTILALALSSVMAQTPVSQAQSASPSAEENVRKLIASLPPISGWRRLLEQGARGDGIHHVWMDEMSDDGVKLAVFNFEFDWTERGKKLTNWRLVSEEYYADYDLRRLISSAERLDKIRSTGLQKTLGNVALARAMKGNWVEYPADDRGTGYRQIFLADNEWLPVQLSPFFGQYVAGTTSLMHAAMLGDVVRIKRLLAQGVDANAIGPDGSTALMWAAAAGTPLAVNALLRAGAKVNLNPSGKGDALIAAVANNRPENVRILLNAGADPNSRNAEGQSALSIASSKNYFDIAKLLTQAGARK